jgi:hypothetical protein
VEGEGGDRQHLGLGTRGVGLGRGLGGEGPGEVEVSPLEGDAGGELGRFGALSGGVRGGEGEADGHRHRDEGRARDEDGDAPRAVEAAEEVEGAVGVGRDEAPIEVAGEVVGEGLRVRVAELGNGGEGLVDDGGELRRDVGGEGLDGGRRAFGSVKEDEGRVVGDVGCPSGDDLEEDRAEAPDVAPGVGRITLGLFGCHVLRRPDDGAGAREIAVAGGLGGARDEARGRADALLPRPVGGRHTVSGEAPVDHLGLAELADHDVRRLDVAVHDARRVGEAEGLGGGQHGAEETLTGDIGVDDEVGQGAAADDAHRDVKGAVGMTPDVVHGDDAWVVQTRGDGGLPCEAGTVGWFEAGGDLLQRDVATELAVVAEEDAAHAPRAEELASDVAFFGGEVRVSGEGGVGRSAIEGFGDTARDVGAREDTGIGAADRGGARGGKRRATAQSWFSRVSARVRKISMLPLRSDRTRSGRTRPSRSFFRRRQSATSHRLRRDAPWASSGQSSRAMTSQGAGTPMATSSPRMRADMPSMTTVGASPRWMWAVS